WVLEAQTGTGIGSVYPFMTTGGPTGSYTEAA
ncbi:MAG: hypothetical protein RLZZ282_1635, partial [Verrucomicrobiota bacterium]